MNHLRYLVLLGLLALAGLLSRHYTPAQPPIAEASGQPIAPASPTAPHATPTPAADAPQESSGTMLLRFPLILADVLAAILPPQEQPVTEIALAGPASEARAEMSGLGWYNDHLILLPQYPERFADGDDGRLFALPKAEIEAVLEGRLDGPLTPQEIPLFAPGLSSTITNFEGFEAIAFVGDEVFLTIESAAGEPMMGYLIKGTIAPDLSEIRLDTATLAEIPPAANHSNMADETLIAAGERLLTVYEVNGTAYNEQPAVHRFDLSATPQGTQPFPAIEYRVTDATAPDEAGLFWALNIFWRGDARWNPVPDVLAARYGQGETHARVRRVERLVAFRVTESGVELVRQPPIQLELAFLPRNWEGLARLDDAGFLVVADEVPRTILGFVPVP